MPTTFRPATHADIDVLLAIENAVFTSDRLSRRSFRALIDRETADAIVAEADGRVAGYAIVLYRKGVAVARLYSIASHPDFAGRGIGSGLLDQAERTAYKHGRLSLRLEVREDNARAIRLYERKGYRKIGRYLDYYADHTDAVRYEKLLRNFDHPTTVPYYEQTEDFTCGPCCLMMAMAKFKPGFAPDPVLEIRLWREATTVFMMSGPGGCEPWGLAVAAHEHGLAPRIAVSADGALFLQSVRSEEKKRVMALAQADFRQRAEAYCIPAEIRPVTPEDISAGIAAGELVAVLVSGFTMFGKKVPHWVLVIGDDGDHFFVHDPWVEDEHGETVADAANIPIPHAVFMGMARYGRDGLRAAVFLGRKNA